MNNKAHLSGLYPPVMTLFRDEKLDLESLAFNIRKMNETSLMGYMPLGSNGEFRALSDEESIRVIRTVKENAAPGKYLMGGAGRESAYHTVEFIKALCEVGIDFASILTPSYFTSKMNDDAIIRYYTYVADHSPVPILIYNAPKFASGVLVSAQVVHTLSQHSNIVGMKDTSSEDISIYTKAVAAEADFYVLAGSINKYIDGLEAGAIGGVLSLSNYLPEQCCKVEALYKAGQPDKARALSDQLIALNKKTAGKYGVAGVKGAMDLLGYKGGEPRNPLRPVSAEALEEMRQVFVQEGYLK